jgi:hypothetical protein
MIHKNPMGAVLEDDYSHPRVTLCLNDTAGKPFPADIK